jgi:hypothetical protein
MWASAKKMNGHCMNPHPKNKQRSDCQAVTEEPTIAPRYHLSGG